MKLRALLFLLAAFPGAALAEDKPAPPTPEAKHEYVSSTIPKPAAVKPFEKVEAQGAGLDPAALERLVKRAEETHTDALIVLKNGKLVGDWRFGKPAGPIEAMSATKSIVNLAIGRLVTTGKLRLTDPVANFYPEWKGTPKEKITVRHLLDHTSGLQANPTTEEIYASRDVVKVALDAPLANEPGTVFFYNNKAVNLLAGIVQKVSGQKMDEYLRDEVFAPVGIAHFSWMRDEAGNPHGMAGLQIEPLDLARLGQLMLGEGTFEGRKILSPEWVRESVQKGEGVRRSGLLWWPLAAWTKMELDDETLDAWRKGGADPAFVAKMATVRGRTVANEGEAILLFDEVFGSGQGIQAYVMNVRAKNLPSLKKTSGPLVGYDANGYLGQYLAVLPAEHLVAVRMIRQESFQSEADNFGDFFQRIQELSPASALVR